MLNIRTTDFVDTRSKLHNNESRLNAKDLNSYVTNGLDFLKHIWPW